MIIAIPTAGDNLDADLDERFGRAANFLFYNTDTDSFTLVPNTQNVQAPQGAGIQSAETVVKHNAHTLLAGHCGPKAFRALQSADINVILGLSGPIRPALTDYLAGKLQPAHNADVEGHW